LKIAQVREFALSLPEVTEEPHFEYSSFRVRRKIFVTVPPAEDRIHVFIGGEELETALEAGPETVEELVWGKKIVGVRVHLARAGAAFVRGLVRQAWLAKAPKSLAARLDDPTARGAKR
jgi:hypothetical protein